MTGARLALGTAQLGMPYGIANRAGQPSTAQAERILDAAEALGIAAIDTAPAYGVAEAVIGRHLARTGWPVSVCTKLPAVPPGVAGSGLRGFVLDAVEASRRNLRRSRIDVYLLHAAADLRLGGPLRDALAECRGRGWIDRIGISVYDPDELRAAAQLTSPAAVQYPYNVFDHRFGAEAAALDGWTTYARSALLQGLFALDPAALPPAVAHAEAPLARFTAVCAALDLSPVDAALGYAAAGAADFVVLGVDSEGQLAASVEALARPLSASQVAEIDAAVGPVEAAVRDPRRWGVA